MSKYDKLWQYIKDHDLDALTFEEIETILGFKIDHSFLSYKKELDDYGYKIDKISMKQKRILIKKMI